MRREDAGGGWKRLVNGFTNPKPTVSGLGQRPRQMIRDSDTDYEIKLQTVSKKRR